MTKSFTFLLILTFAVSACTKKHLAPSGLMTELLRAPEQAVITDSVPEFGWIFPAEGITQTACQILVATSKELLDNKADLWDSGKLETDNTINLSYNGNKLQPEQTYFWKVKVWGENGFESEFSEIQQFNTGDFNRDPNKFIGYSDWVKLSSGDWVAENRQMATFTTIEPNFSEQTSDNSWFFDFGKAAFGTLEFEVEATESGSVTVYLGERNVGKTVHKNPGTTNIGYFQTKIEIQKGKNSYQVEIPSHEAQYPHSQKLPPFYPEVTPFRYVEIIGENLKIDKVKQKALFYYFDDTASSFNSPNNNLNNVWNLCKYTLKATPFLGVYCDGNRERMPYEADAYIQQLGHYSVDREYSAARYTIAYLLSNASWPTEWQMHTVMMAREHFMYTGDTKFLQAIYEELKHKTLIDLEDENGLISTRTGKVTPEFLKSIHFEGGNFSDIVDWPPGTPKGEQTGGGPQGNTTEGERDGYVFTDYNTVVNAFHFYSLNCMEDIAKALGKTDDQRFYKEQKEKVRKAVLENMFDAERGVFVDGIGTDHASLHANMFPLAFNLVPEKDIKSVAEFIKTRGMACSVYGAQYLLEALYNAGEADYALEMMTKDDKRSWMNMLNVGSTMTTEAWDEFYKPNLTWNHAWGSAPANIIPRRLMGIQPLDAGWKTFTVNPQPNSLSSIQIKIPTIRGEIECQLESNENEWNMHLSVPGNSEAFVLLPFEFGHINVNSQTKKPDSKIDYLGMSRNLIRLKAGTHFISAKK